MRDGGKASRPTVKHSTDSKKMITIQAQGNNPITNFLATEEQLLIAAWAYGLKVGDKIHRFSLYAFIQSHLANKTEENLQKSLETNSQNWTGLGKGIYTLTDSGYRQLSKFGTPNFLIPLGSLFTFSRTIDHYIISVTVDPTKPKYIAKQNGVAAKADIIIENIKDVTTDRIATSQTSLPRQIMNWILRDNSYQWLIENFTVPQFSFSEPTVEENEDEKEQSEIIKEIRNDSNSKQSIIAELQNLKETDPEIIVINSKSYKRDNKTIAQIKFIREFKCQICGTTIKKKDGSNYVEAAHIKPKHKKGRETPDNIILLCPNHHKEFDIGDRRIISQDANQIIFTLNGQRHEIALLIK